ncbi:MAG: hypothetical protein U9O87_04520 [Verrucomicrobiota bacterium]|nr:hypothetical protein [Verrucomicrobiota bacterium]
MPNKFIDQSLITTKRFGVSQQKKILESKHEKSLEKADRNTKQNMDIASYDEYSRNLNAVAALISEILHPAEDELTKLKLDCRIRENTIAELKKTSSQINNLSVDSELPKKDSKLLRKSIYELEKARRRCIQIQNQLKNSTHLEGIDKKQPVQTTDILSLSFFQLTRLGIAFLWPLALGIIVAVVMIVYAIFSVFGMM